MKTDRLSLWWEGIQKHFDSEPLISKLWFLSYTWYDSGPPSLCKIHRLFLHKETLEAAPSSSVGSQASLNLLQANLWLTLCPQGTPDIQSGNQDKRQENTGAISTESSGIVKS